MLHKSKSVSIADLFRMSGTGRHIFDYPPEMWEAIAKAVPHPLKKFAVADGYFVEGPHAQALLDVISDATLEKPGSNRALVAQWFLLESEQAYFEFCKECGVDAEKLRKHLRKQHAKRNK